MQLFIEYKPASSILSRKRMHKTYASADIHVSRKDKDILCQSAN